MSGNLRCVKFIGIFLLVVCLGICGRLSAQGSPMQNQIAQADKPFGNPAMKSANEAASMLMKARMMRDRPKDFDLLRKVKKSEVIVVTGEYDHVETVLDAVKVAHLVVYPSDLDMAELNASQMLIINCPGKLSNKAIEKVRKFVKAGGFLFTTDWSLLYVLEKAFPGIVEFTRKPTADDVVEVRKLKEDHTFLQHVRNTKETPKWWLETSSYPIRILDKKKVEVLMESDELKRKYGESPVAITFKYGDGQVLHIISHFYLQRTESRTAWEKGGGEKFGSVLGMKMKGGGMGGGMPGSAAAALKKTTAGAVKDAYAMQQFSANFIVAKRKQNAQLTKLYNYQAKTNTILHISPAASSGKAADLKKGTLLKPLQKKDDWQKVQTFSGDVGWVKMHIIENK